MYLEINSVAAEFQNIFKIHKWEYSNYTKTLHLFINNKKNITYTKETKKSSGGHLTMLQTCFSLIGMPIYLSTRF